MTADLRLFPAAAGLWGAAILTVHLSTVVALAVASASLLAAALAATYARRRSRRGVGSLDGARTADSGGRLGRRRAGRERRAVAAAWIAAGALLGVVGGCVVTAARVAARDGADLSRLAAARATVWAEATVTDDPRALATNGVGPATYLVPVRLTRVVSVDRALSLDVRILVFAQHPGWRGLLPSTRLATEGRLGPARGGDLTAAVLTATGEPEVLAVASWAQRAAGVLRAGLQAACADLPPEPGGLLPGLVIGDTSRLDPALEEDFRATGLTHLTAVSGANLAIVLGVVLFAARWCRAGPWLSAGICALALIGFVILARPSPSVVRAAAMGAIGLLALASGRPRAAAPALAAAAMVALVIDPGLAVDAGFALSVLATGALVLLAPRWCDGLRGRGWPLWLAAAIAAPAAAQVACGPVIAALSGGVSLVAVPANLLAALAVAPATLLGVGAALVSALWPGGASLLAWVGAWPARWLVAIAHAGADVPVGTVPWPAGLVGAASLAVLTVAAVMVWRWPPVRRYLVVAALAVGIGVVPLRVVASGWPPDGAVLVVCDVGQGDALVLPVGDGAAVVVDTGPDPVPVDGCLRRLGVRSVPLLVLTHFHADHIGGLAGVLRQRTIGQVVGPDFAEPASGRAAVLKTLAGRPLGAVGPAWTFALRGLWLRLLGPTQRHTATRSDPNNNSVVLRAELRGVSMLLTGDAETEEQHDLLALRPDQLRADVLKVAHHGSAYQDDAFLDAVDPAVAVVSVGLDNSYGHPHPGLLAELVRDGARVARTDLSGDVAVVATARGLGLVGARAPP